jgi:hypothetical protein
MGLGWLSIWGSVLRKRRSVSAMFLSICSRAGFVGVIGLLQFCWGGLIEGERGGSIIHRANVVRGTGLILERRMKLWRWILKK